jgi:hypothetical protein
MGPRAAKIILLGQSRNPQDFSVETLRLLFFFGRHLNIQVINTLEHVYIRTSVVFSAHSVSIKTEP